MAKRGASSDEAVGGIATRYAEHTEGVRDEVAILAESIDPEDALLVGRSVLALMATGHLALVIPAGMDSERAVAAVGMVWSGIDRASRLAAGYPGVGVIELPPIGEHEEAPPVEPGGAVEERRPD